MSDTLNLFAIGGGNLAANESIINTAIESTGREHPNILVVPSSKSTPVSYNKIAQATDEFFTNLGKSYEILHPFLGDEGVISQNEIEDKIFDADLIHISGGNYPYLQRLWGRLHIAEIMKRSMQDGKTITGISTGALVMFREGISDPNTSREEAADELKDFIVVDGLGTIQAVACVHYHDINENRPMQRRDAFLRMVGEGIFPNEKIGIDSMAALVSIGGIVNVAKAREGVSVFQIIHDEDGSIVEVDMHSGDSIKT